MWIRDGPTDDINGLVHDANLTILTWPIQNIYYIRRPSCYGWSGGSLHDLHHISSAVAAPYKSTYIFSIVKSSSNPSPSSSSCSIIMKSSLPTKFLQSSCSPSRHVRPHPPSTQQTPTNSYNASKVNLIITSLPNRFIRRWCFGLRLLLPIEWLYHTFRTDSGSSSSWSSSEHNISPAYCDPRTPLLVAGCPGQYNKCRASLHPFESN